jgi:two-component system chemotaxis response regulator CheB
MGTIRVLVVEDSITIRKRIVEVLGSDPDLHVVAEAADGKQAIDLCERHRPDVITLDMMLPVMSGLAATEYIMAHRPTPIVIVSASMNRGEVFKTYDALAAGAIDVLDKPTNGQPDGVWEERLVATVKLASRIKVITHPRASLNRFRGHDGRPGVAPVAPRDCAAVAIGGSTGGPAAVLDILRALPASFPVPILLVIHIGALFAAPFAEWLNEQSPFRVDFARDGQPMPFGERGRVVLAPPDQHLVARDGRLRLSNAPERHSCRPSVDVLFESVASDLGARVAACLLTGMGKDGAAGLLAIRRAGGATIVQDETTSIVFGMPREAIALGAAERVLPLGEIAPALAAVAGAGKLARQV